MSMHETPHQPPVATADPDPVMPAIEDDEVGDAPCWQKRVCPECGTLADEDPPTICPACGAELPAQ